MRMTVPDVRSWPNAVCHSTAAADPKQPFDYAFESAYCSPS
jgi:hypothetical protein